MKVIDFINQWNGGGYDIDNSYGVQCVDLFKIFCFQVWGGFAACPNGWAESYFTKFEEVPFLTEHFERIAGHEFKNGDWVVFPYGCTQAPHSHICMYYNGQAFGTNQNGANGATLVNVDWSQAAGILRPLNVWEADAPQTNSIDALAMSVIRGDFGNGEQRKAALGTDYEAVQARVNEILSNEVPTTPNIDELARAVIRGDYGNGQERKDRLGADYDAVQARVNEMLGG